MSGERGPGEPCVTQGSSGESKTIQFLREFMNDWEQNDRHWSFFEPMSIKFHLVEIRGYIRDMIEINKISGEINKIYREIKKVLGEINKIWREIKEICGGEKPIKHENGVTQSIRWACLSKREAKTGRLVQFRVLCSDSDCRMLDEWHLWLTRWDFESNRIGSVIEVSNSWMKNRILWIENDLIGFPVWEDLCCMRCNLWMSE